MEVDGVIDNVPVIKDDEWLTPRAEPNVSSVHPCGHRIIAFHPNLIRCGSLSHTCGSRRTRSPGGAELTDLCTPVCLTAPERKSQTTPVPVRRLILCLACRLGIDQCFLGFATLSGKGRSE